jgi:hypothetical protein
MRVGYNKWVDWCRTSLLVKIGSAPNLLIRLGEGEAPAEPCSKRYETAITL